MYIYIEYLQTLILFGLFYYENERFLDGNSRKKKGTVFNIYRINIFIYIHMDSLWSLYRINITSYYVILYWCRCSLALKLRCL